MNRPDPTEHENRTEVMQTRVTLAEQAYVQEVAREAGITVSEFLRRRACGYQVPAGPRRRSVNPELVTAINRVGVNINQIALRLNCDRPERVSIDETMEELQMVLAMVVSEMSDADDIVPGAEIMVGDG
ncbi:MAG: plasmid mobilization relaxosome protein MobC [Phycisphaerales bacterium]|nr:plasmid mobilization relaxosome protein MobC [Phycisphaerales bacterium]